MSYLGSWKIDDLLSFYANTQRFDTGNATDADAVPAYRVYEDETGTPILTGNMALIDSSNTAGFYSEQITLSAANGFEKGKCYSIHIAATVNGVAGTAHKTLQIEAEVDANTVSGVVPTVTNLTNAPTAGDFTATMKTSVTTAATAATPTISTLGNNTITAASIAADAITDAKVAADVTIASVTGAVGSVSGLTASNLDATVSSRATAASVSSIATDVTTLLGRVPAALFAGITSLAQWLGLLAGKQLGNSTARTELQATGAGSGTFDETADSTEAIRDRGDAAWTSGSGLTQADVRTAVGLASANLDTQLADLPTNAELSTALGTADDAILARLPTALTGAGNIKADMLAVNGSTTAAARQALAAAQMIPFTVTTAGFSPTTTQFEASDITEATADHFNGAVVIWTSGALAGQRTAVSDYALVGGRGHLTVVAMTEAAANGDTGILV